MASIEKTTLPISKVAVVIIAISGFLITVLTQYYTTKSAIQEGFNTVNSEIQDLRNEDKMIKRDVSELEKRTDKMEDMAFKYVDALKPEEPKIKRER
jgi:cell division protein FtsL